LLLAALPRHGHHDDVLRQSARRVCRRSDRRAIAADLWLAVHLCGRWRIPALAAPDLGDLAAGIAALSDRARRQIGARGRDPGPPEPDPLDRRTGRRYRQRQPDRAAVLARLW